MTNWFKAAVAAAGMTCALTGSIDIARAAATAQITASGDKDDASFNLDASFIFGTSFGTYSYSIFSDGSMSPPQNTKQTVTNVYSDISFFNQDGSSCSYLSCGSAYITFNAVNNILLDNTGSGFTVVSVQGNFPDNDAIFIMGSTAQISLVPLPSAIPMFGSALIILGAAGFAARRRGNRDLARQGA